MQFVFHGTLEQLKETIRAKAKEHDKDIVVYHNEPNVLQVILGGYIKDSALPGVRIEKKELSEHCSKCNNAKAR